MAVGDTLRAFGRPDASVAALLERHAGLSGAPALLAPGREALGYGDLRAHVVRVGERLGGLSIGRGDRVALLVPNGPEAATAFLGVAAAAVCAWRTRAEPPPHSRSPCFRTSRLRAQGLRVRARLLVLRAKGRRRALARTRFELALGAATKVYVPPVYAGRLAIVDTPDHPAPRSQWAAVGGDAIDLRTLPFGHSAMFRQPNAELVGRTLRELLRLEPV